MDEDIPLALSREDLYELAWSKPISELSKDFGISDVALAKRCRRLGIPLPGRGYWARVEAGQKPYRPKLPKRQPEWYDHGALTVAPLASPSSTETPDSYQPADALWLSERIAFEKRPENEICVEQPPTRWTRSSASIETNYGPRLRRCSRQKQPMSDTKSCRSRAGRERGTATVGHGEVCSRAARGFSTITSLDPFG